MHHSHQKVKVAQLCPTLCDPMDYTVHGILQARILEGVAFPFSRGSFQPRDQTHVSCIAGGFLPAESPGKPKNTEWVAFPFSRSSQPRYQTRVPYIAGGFFTNWAIREVPEQGQKPTKADVPNQTPDPDIPETILSLQPIPASLSEGSLVLAQF